LAVDELRADLEDFLSSSGDKWGKIYDLGYAAIYTDGTRTIHENRFTTPITFDWRSFDASLNDNVVSVSLPSMSIPTSNIQTFGGASGYVLNSEGQFEGGLVATPTYSAELVGEVNQEGGIVVVLGVRSTD